MYKYKSIRTLGFYYKARDTKDKVVILTKQLQYIKEYIVDKKEAISYNRVIINYFLIRGDNIANKRYLN